MRSVVLIDPEDIGKKADIFIIASHMQEDMIYSYESNQNFKRWNGDLEELNIAFVVESLENFLEISMDLSQMMGSGEWLIYLAYRLENGVIVCNGLDAIYESR